MGFKVLLAAQMHMHCGLSPLLQVQLYSVEQARTDALALPRGLDIEPVELYLGRAGMAL